MAERPKNQNQNQRPCLVCGEVMVPALDRVCANCAKAG